MYDELVKRIWECASGECFNCSQYTETTNASVCSKELMKQAANAIEKLSKPRWIPVTERLPEEDGWYQVYAPSYSGGSSSGLKNIKGNMYSAFKNGKWSIEVGYHKRPGCVKAWMPLPEPPKEEAT